MTFSLSKESTEKSFLFKSKLEPLSCFVLCFLFIAIVVI